MPHSSLDQPRKGFTLLQVVVPLALLLGGVAVAGFFISQRPEATQAEAVEVAVPVEVTTVQLGEQVAHVHGTGTVQADQQIVLVPQVSGRITSVSAALRPGGRVSRGDVLARIDARDYQLSKVQAQSQVAQAQLSLELEQSRGQVAQREWGLVGEGEQPATAPLALRGPQLVAAQQGLAAAEATLGSAELAIERTALRAPFDAVVISEGVDVGQVVGPSTQVANLVGSTRLRVEVKVPVETLPSLVIPGIGGQDEVAEASAVTITQHLTRGGAGDRSVQRSGQVLGLGGQLDAATRTATVIVVIDDPLGDGSELPLLPGAFVDVDIAGRSVPDVLVLPRVGVREGSVAWVVGADDRLVRRELDIAWKEGEQVFVRSGLEDGARVVVSPLALPLAGMAVRITAGVPQ